MSLERPNLAADGLAATDATSSARLELVPDTGEPPFRPSLRTFDIPGRTPPAPGIGDLVPTSLDAPELYLNRELTYLNFCWRVMHEAEDERVPMLERVKFLAIVSANIDEFFQKRIGGLKQQVGAQLHAMTPDGRTPQQQIADGLDLINRLETRKAQILEKLTNELKAIGVWIAPFKELDAQQRAWVREYYVRNIFPLVTPQAMDPAHPFPFVSNLSLNLLVSLRYENDSESLLARVKVPVGAGVGRFVRLGSSRTFVDLVDVMANNLDLLFPGMEIEQCSLFRVTRNAITEQDEEEADDLLEMIEIELRKRKFAPVVRLQVDGQMPAQLRGRLAAELGLDEGMDVFDAQGTLGQRDLMEIGTLDIPELRDTPHAPAQPVDFISEGNIFHAIRDAKSMLVHHPYESFQESVERFLREASTDPKVRAIKMTLYRTSKDSDVIKHLVRAAQERQAGRGRARAQGALRRRGQHQVGLSHGAFRHPCHLRRGRAQDPHQDHAGRAQRLRRPTPLRARRDRQLPRRHRASIHRPRAVHVRRRDRPRPHRAVQLPDHRIQAAPQVPEDAGRAEDAQARAAREDRARDRRASAPASAATSSGSSTRSRTSTSCARCTGRRSAA